MITIKPVSKSEIGEKTKCKRVTEVTKTLQKFIASGYEAVEISYDNEEWANANNFRKSFANSIKANNFDVRVTIRGARVFLVRE